MIDKQMIALMSSTLSGWDASNAVLKFSPGNAKIEGIFNVSIPAGHSCPFAKDCLSKTVISDKTPCGFGIQDGKDTKWRCFTATDESKYPAVRNQRWFNFLTILEQKSVKALADLIERSLPVSKWGAPIRIHVGGDFFKQMYFDAWIEVAARHPKQVFYAYTKALPLWVKRLNVIPKNFKLTASYGGTHDDLIAEYNLKYCKVVFSVSEATKLGLEIDHDDSLAYGSDKPFSLILHGMQPAGTSAAKAWSKLKKQGIGGYRNQKAKRIKVSSLVTA